MMIVLNAVSTLFKVNGYQVATRLYDLIQLISKMSLPQHYLLNCRSNLETLFLIIASVPQYFYQKLNL
jgi:hypothetical protein